MTRPSLLSFSFQSITRSHESKLACFTRKHAHTLSRSTSSLSTHSFTFSIQSSHAQSSCPTAGLTKLTATPPPTDVPPYAEGAGAGAAAPLPHPWADPPPSEVPPLGPPPRVDGGRGGGGTTPRADPPPTPPAPGGAMGGRGMLGMTPRADPPEE
jgi:hypothetical protein